TRVVAIEPERLARRAEDLTRTADEFRAAAWVSASAGAEAPLEAAAATFLSLDEIREASEARGLDWATIGPFGAADAATAPITDVEDYRGRLEQALGQVRARMAEGWNVVI